MIDRNELRKVIKKVYNTQSNNMSDVVSSYKESKGLSHVAGRIDDMIYDIAKKEIKELFNQK